MNANKFIALNNDQLVFTSGKYIVGKDIPAGEYYFWGKDIWYSYTIMSEKFPKEFVYDAYATFEAGTTLTVSRGKFTPVFNIIYNREPNELLYPDHVYRVGGEISTGYYIFKFDKKYFSESLSPFCVDNDATLSTSKTYPLSLYTRFSGYVGIAEVKANDNFAFVNNGIAEFYGEQPINLYSLISSTSLQNNRLYRRGETVFSSRLCNIIVYKRDSNRIYFHGASDAYIYEQYIYSINGTNFWTGFVNVLTFKPFHWLEMILENSDTGKQYRFGKGQIDIKSITNLSHSSKDRSFREYCFSKKCLYEIRLPEGAELGKISVVGLRPEHSAEDLYLVSADIRTIYSREFNKMAFVLNQFQNLGLQIDIENDLYHFEKCPDLLLICLDFFRKVFGFQNFI